MTNDPVIPKQAEEEFDDLSEALWDAINMALQNGTPPPVAFAALESALVRCLACLPEQQREPVLQFHISRASALLAAANEMVADLRASLN